MPTGQSDCSWLRRTQTESWTFDKNSCSKSIEIEVVVTTSDGRIISIGKLSPKNTSINFDTSSFGTECLITGLKFDIKNSGMHQRQIVLEGSTT